MLILLPAAGASLRMRGRDKLLEPVAGTPLLTRQMCIALATGAELLVTLPPGNARRRALVEDVRNARLHVQDLANAAEGLSASLRAGADLAQRQKAAALMILLADMPEIETADLTAMIRAFDGQTVLRACDDSGAMGHPVILPARLFPALRGLRGDRGAQEVIHDQPQTAFPLPGKRATTDLDTPEDWENWRHRPE